MRHSIYIKLATWLIRADLRRKERAWQRTIRRTANDIPWHNEHLLRDIGLGPGGRYVGKNPIPDKKVNRRLNHIRRLYRLRIPT